MVNFIIGRNRKGGYFLFGFYFLVNLVRLSLFVLGIEVLVCIVLKVFELYKFYYCIIVIFYGEVVN